MRLVDADKLKEDLFIKFGNQLPEGLFKEIDKAPTEEGESYAKGYQDGAEDGLQGIRPKGHWIRKVDVVGFVSNICSECGAEIELEDCSDNKFCMNCGADMREGEV